MSRKKRQISDLNLSNVGDRIAYLRLSRDMTQDQFSKLTGFSKGNVNGLESHKYEPSYRAITRLIELFEVDSDWLLFGKKSSSSTGNLPQVVLEHIEIIKKFKNPKEGKDANEGLVELQDSDTDLYEKAINTINKLRAAARALKDIPSGNYSAPSAGSNGTMNSQRKQKLPKGAKKNGTSG